MEFKKVWTSGGGSFDEIADEILTGKDLEAYKASVPKILEYELELPGLVPALQVLDFGTGMGRALHHIKQKHPGWRVVGYDNMAMIGRIHKVWPRLTTTPGVNITRHWKVVEDCRYYDQINAELVFQHMHEDILHQRLPEMAKLLSRSQFNEARLFLHTRRTFDDLKTPVLPIVLNYFTVETIHDAEASFVYGSGTYKDHFTLSLKPRNRA